jgi:hypothetical protein
MSNNPNPQNPIVNQEALNQQNVEQVPFNPEQLPAHLATHISQEYWNSLTYEQRDLLNKVDHLPNQLKGIVPESVWGTLSLDQKIEFLNSHNLLPVGGVIHNRFEGSTFDGGMGESTPEIWGDSDGNQTQQQSVEFQPGFTGEVNIQQDSEIHNEFEQAVQQIEVIEKEHVQEIEHIEEADVPLTAEDQSRIATESGQNFVMNAPKISGYKPDDTIVNNIHHFSEGPADLGTTWTAAILKKLMGVLN